MSAQMIPVFLGCFLFIRVLLTLFISILLVFGGATFHQTGTLDTDCSVEEFTHHLYERIPSLMNDYQIPGVAIALVHNGEIKWEEAFGY